MADLRLTERQTDCVARVARGLSSKEIARELGISPSTVDNHVASAMHHYGFSTRAAVAKWYVEQVNGAEAVPILDNELELITKVRSKSNRFLAMPPLGGATNGLTMKQRFFSVSQVVIVSIMVASSAITFVLGLIFLLRNAIGQ
jgi:DNA-binding CsgD family transcriptional regulator